jgi:uncharacterized protein (UPF0548 family)
MTPSQLTYTEVGGTIQLPLPHGYQHVVYHTRLGTVSFEDAAEAVETFAMHRAAGIKMITTAPRAAKGVRVTASVGVGPIRVLAPCEVIAVVADADRRGFAYGTLAGHPERGEEAFFVTRESGVVFFEMRAFSRPARWFTRIGEPFAPYLQRLYAWNLARALHKILRESLLN